MSDNNTRLKESLSALMDGEADELEVQRALKAVSEDSGLRATWQRYHLAGSVMRNEDTTVNIDISASIAAAIEDEPEYSGGTLAHSNRFIKPLSRMAIAASMTVAVVLGVQQYNQSNSGAASSQTIANNPEVNTPLPSPFNTPIPTRTVSKESDKALEPMFELDEGSKRQLEKKLDELMEEKAQRSNTNSN